MLPTILAAMVLMFLAVWSIAFGIGIMLEENKLGHKLFPPLVLFLTGLGSVCLCSSIMMLVHSANMYTLTVPMG